MGEFGDFSESEDREEASAEGAAEPAEGQEGFVRARMPREGQVIGVILQRLGGNRMEVKGTDGKTRNCRVPGRFKRSMWLRPNDIVMVEPWPDDNTKGDVVYKYGSSQINQLRKKGVLKSLSEGF
jgi:translation initiation factor 1A